MSTPEAFSLGISVAAFLMALLRPTVIVKRNGGETLGGYLNETNSQLRRLADATIASNSQRRDLDARERQESLLRGGR